MTHTVFYDKINIMKAVYKTVGIKEMTSAKAFKEESNYLDNLTYKDSYLFCVNLLRPQFNEMLDNPEVTLVETNVSDLGTSDEFLSNVLSILAKGKDILLTDAQIEIKQSDFNIFRLIKDQKKYIRKKIIAEQQELKLSLDIKDNLIGRPKAINNRISNLVLELRQEGLSYSQIQSKITELGESPISKTSICRILKAHKDDDE